MFRLGVLARVAVGAVLLSLLIGAGGQKPTSYNFGFEEGLQAPWGTGQKRYSQSVWWNSGGCASTAKADARVRRNGNYSLSINNPSPRGPEVYGTTQQPLSFTKGHRYRVQAWALARNLESDGGVSLIVDDAWKVRPIKLPRGTYDWRKLSGDFVWSGGEGQCRILSEDRGQVWLDDISITDLGPAR